MHCLTCLKEKRRRKKEGKFAFFSRQVRLCMGDHILCAYYHVGHKWWYIGHFLAWVRDDILLLCFLQEWLQEWPPFPKVMGLHKDFFFDIACKHAKLLCSQVREPFQFWHDAVQIVQRWASTLGINYTKNSHVQREMSLGVTKMK